MHEQHNSSSLYSCTICDKIYQNRSMLEEHIEINHNSGIPCIVCDQILMNNSELEDHIEANHKHHTAVPCSICNKMFPNKTNLDTHLRKAHDSRLNYDVCDQNSGNEEQVIEHILNVHKGQGPLIFLQPSIIPKDSASSSENEIIDQLDGNVRHHHGQQLTTHEPALIHCNFCDYIFYNMSHLNVHTRTNHEKELISLNQLPQAGDYH
jgi:hypothetical protein